MIAGREQAWRAITARPTLALLVAGLFSTFGFAPLGLVSDAAMTIMARPGFQAEDMRGLVAEISRRGEALNIGTAGLASAANLCALLMQQQAQSLRGIGQRLRST